MKKKSTTSQDPVLEANIRFHTALAKKYESSQPYFDPANLERVTGTLTKIAESAGSNSLIDIGCGTGFLCEIAKPIFDKVVGLDATPAMLSLANSSQNIHLVLGDARQIPYPDESFNACCAYGVLHHIKDLPSVIKEIFRILKPDGVFYSDEDPNFDYFQFIESLPPNSEVLPGLVQNEHKNVTAKALEMKEQFNVDEETTKLAEYQKMTKGGMRPHETQKLFRQNGFSDVQIEYRWYLGQAKIRSDFGIKNEELIHDYLTSTLPVSSRMFKYFKLLATK